MNYGLFSKGYTAPNKSKQSSKEVKDQIKSSLHQILEGMQQIVIENSQNSNFLNQSQSTLGQKIWKTTLLFDILYQLQHRYQPKSITQQNIFSKYFYIYNLCCHMLQIIIICIILSMEYGETHTSKLMQLLHENLLESNFELLKNLASENGMPASIRNSIINITQLFEQANRQTSNYQNDVFFYRDFLKNLLNEETTEFNINNRTDISSQKREQALKLLSKIKYTEQSRIEAQSQLKNRNSQLEELMRQSIIQQNTEQVYMQKEEMLQSILQDRESRINDLQSKIATQLKQLTEKNKLVEEYHKKIKNQQSELLDLRQRQAEKTSEILQLSLFRQKFDEIKQLFKKQEKKSKILGSQLEQKLSFIQSCTLQKQEVQEKLKKTEEQNSTLKLEMDALKDQLEKSRMIKKKSTKEIFIDTNSIIQQFQMNQKVAASFQQKLNAIIGQVTSMSSLYNHSLHKGENFHRRVDNKKNILLLCKTAGNRIIGGFTSNGFSLKPEQKQAKAFLFSFYDEEMKVFQLKRGKTSTTYDNDYIIFGNEELCIQKGSDQLTSYFVNGSQNILHYHCDNSSDRQTFLSISEFGTDVVKLLNYEIIELKIKIPNDQDKRA